MIFEDQLAALEADSRKIGTQGGEIDFALLVDGLAAEREQGITIDVAYRFFSTDKRKFIVADTPGHVQYTRNMVTGASSANLSVVLVDARQGVIEQTRRHTYLAALLGIPHVVIAVNKMDLVDWSEERFLEIRDAIEDFLPKLDVLKDVKFIPISALNGDNVVERSKHIPMRLTLMERKYLRLLEAALNVSEYVRQTVLLSWGRGMTDILWGYALADGQG